MDINATAKEEASVQNYPARARFEFIQDVRRDDYIRAKRIDPKGVKKFEAYAQERRVYV